MKKTMFNLKPNIAGALCYSVGALSGIIMYIFEIRRDTKSPIIIFHALQSIVLLGGASLLYLYYVPYHLQDFLLTS